MKSINLVAPNDPILATYMKPIGKLTKKQKKELKLIMQALENDKRVLAFSANQLGIRLRAFAYRNNNDIHLVVDPEIVWASEGHDHIIEDGGEKVQPQETMWEWCASFPDKKFLIVRPYAIRVEYANENGVKKNIMLNKIWARLFCHEIDHLNGILPEDIAIKIEDDIKEQEENG